MTQIAVMESNHEIVIGSVGNMSDLRDESVELIVISPLFPMTAMRDFNSTK